jgi:hypothetical protein
VLHEIEWWSTSAIGHWVIEASDVEFAWKLECSPFRLLTVGT